ncbi:MAG: acetyl/propionyl/methylcrotonyl-CoA carboxylase subunit alpha [Kordiimonadaceae bacterium]|jgi:propionyl-CoA carboxylase alpha chain|nr:acetyl/propionyl/methylcrotonyl-CoA carboxylase subunit alpha [Kordiimonadaceae bacterium]MBT6037079.1 acetyl/propionyl/methylcrotonyl-CoA carboxylase subunit alpha [Kordiimonadaceae bacterium]MBT6329794.1 acetyl/propionyl/methylcrotonyl-CoA carboxylase subunit alpha [Kordiimonadaceae bacterium]
MFNKILIANRGEIACRVIKTAKEMGILTVAIYSDADADALHVRMADEKIHIGKSPAAESYLIADKIIEAAKQTGADAIHPGYGFLSENADFCKKLDKEGITFIGPGTKAIGVMGDKISSKILAEETGVNTIPGYLDVIKDSEEAVKVSNDIGYPVMLKASAGGGGKGMRVVYNDDEVREGFNSAANEAKSSFGDDRVFAEKFIENPRHIEIQVLGDKHGNIIYLAERECSIQRRHQKVIEEAPSAFLNEETRASMGAQSVALSKAVDYSSAGTVEFIVDKDQNFYFLEMNTRLQVEHPVTELITGIDLVEQMIRSAAGEPLNIAQQDVAINGWAMEARVYAEDPLRGFLPSTGRVTDYIQPEEDDHIRVDSGIYAGSEISIYYDPMISKVISYGENRDEAIDKLRLALDEYYIRGVGHNISFLSDVLKSARFRSGDISTKYIEEEYKDGFNGGTLSLEAWNIMIAVASTVHSCEIGRQTTISGKMNEDASSFSETWQVHIDGEIQSANFLMTGEGCNVITGGLVYEIQTLWAPGTAVFTGTINNEKVSVEVDYLPDGYRLTYDGASEIIHVRDEREMALSALMPEKVPADMSKYLQCPMPGLVVSIDVDEGDEVQPGQTLCVIEAMKMENVLRAERQGKIAKISAEAGGSLAVDAIIMEFE